MIDSAEEFQTEPHILARCQAMRQEYAAATVVFRLAAGFGGWGVRLLFGLPWLLAGGLLQAKTVFFVFGACVFSNRW
ncbi:MAG: hypothetical protein KBI18_07070 [Brachymonas sp.]|jgi:hypothetical protein|nr:hypothetical protein [Brachymonas sp.]MBP8597375.1 hypothetical protein [Brachymonas sp.]